MCQFFDNRGYPASVVQAGHHRAQQIDRQSALQTTKKENTDRIPFTLTFHPHNYAVKCIILKKLEITPKRFRDWYYLFATPSNFIHYFQIGTLISLGINERLSFN